MPGGANGLVGRREGERGRGVGGLGQRAAGGGAHLANTAPEFHPPKAEFGGPQVGAVVWRLRGNGLERSAQLRSGASQRPELAGGARARSAARSAARTVERRAEREEGILGGSVRFGGVGGGDRKEVRILVRVVKICRLK